MIRRAFIAALLAAVTVHPALAAKSEEPSKDAPIGQYVDLLPVAVPILAEGQLVNYVFVTMRVNLTSSANASKWRGKEPFFRDALARLGSRGSFGDSKDYAAVDAPRLIAAFQREAVTIAGNDVKNVVITAQTAKQRRGLPKPGPRPVRAEIRP
ncbi:MAG: hypothetical protein C0481_07980 [Phenylobacterium sp.]|uniref:hypothetical protein n=1 Tax=Phenylobacterium sp. TaxID=1871053 RepID=UPI0025F95167|nr:hypothetical protein [Phenylobacterium sp.]MBA4011787.1 hypothetical protein [Phenylobacterium sp.]